MVRLTIVVNVSDGYTNINMTAFNLTVNPIDDLPVKTTAIGDRTVQESGPSIDIIAGAHASDVDNPLIWSGVTGLDAALYSIIADTLRLAADPAFIGTTFWSCSHSSRWRSRLSSGSI